MHLLPALAAGDEPPNDTEPVIPSGQEALLAEILGRGESLAGGCRFAGGQAEPTVVRARYACPGGEVAVELLHPNSAPSTAVRTQRFAIVLKSGSAPAGFADELLSRIRARETEFRWQSLPKRPVMDTVLVAAVIALPSAAMMVGGVLVARAFFRRRQRAAKGGRVPAASPRTIDLVRAAGLLVVVIVSFYGAATRSAVPANVVATFLGVLPLAAFLWLTVTGFFGSGAVHRDDWVGVVPFLVALGLREIFTLHSIQEIEIQFSEKFIGRHSVVYPLFQMFYAPLVRDPQWFTMHVNGVLGAVASLSLYVFIRQRFGSRAAGFVCALFLALHPVVARFSPTDGPYALLLAAWFSGLALLSASPLETRSMIGGAGLLGIAATARIEGIAFLIASALMLDPKVLIDGIRRDRVVAAFSLLLIAAMVAVHWYFLLPFHLGNQTPSLPGLNALIDDAVWPASYNDPIFMALMWVGALAGIFRRYRLGMLAYAAMVVVSVPVVPSGQWPVSLHRMVPTCALQTIVAGIGAFALTVWIAERRQRYWLAAVPGGAVAVYILVRHWSALTTPYVFTEEYQLVRDRFAPGGIAETGCTLMTFNSNVGGDADLNDFSQVVPGMRVVDCTSIDCLAELNDSGCVYYVRSAACYFRAVGVLPACAETGVAAANDRIACLSERSASFEKSVALQRVEVRAIDILGTFPGAPPKYPRMAEVGLFRVRRPGGE